MQLDEKEKGIQVVSKNVCLFRNLGHFAAQCDPHLKPGGQGWAVVPRTGLQAEVGTSPVSDAPAAARPLCASPPTSGVGRCEPGFLSLLEPSCLSSALQPADSLQSLPILWD